MGFSDYLSNARAQLSDEDEALSEIYNQLETSYNDVYEGSVNAISAKDERIKGLESEVSRLKTQMFDQMQMIPAMNQNQEDEPDEDDSDTNRGVAGLFTRK